MVYNSSKRPTLQDVAQAAGVSKQTVSRVINNSHRVLPETRERVMASIRALGYSPNRAAQMLNTRKSQTLEVLTIDTETSLFRQTLTQMTLSAQQYNYNISFSTFDRGQLAQALENSASRLVDGVILIPSLFLDDLEDEIVTTYQQDIPTVQITPKIGLDIASVAYNQAAGMQMIAEHIINLGHHQFAEIYGRENMIETDIRHQVWLETAQKYGVDPGPAVCGDFVVQGGYDGAKTLLDSGASFTALVCANDRIALGALHALHERGIRVPEDVSIIGYDDIEGADHFFPPLTTVAMDFHKLGQLAINYLVERIKKPDAPEYQRVLMPELVIRESTARYLMIHR